MLAVMRQTLILIGLIGALGCGAPVDEDGSGIDPEADGKADDKALPERIVRPYVGQAVGRRFFVELDRNYAKLERPIVDLYIYGHHVARSTAASWLAEMFVPVDVPEGSPLEIRVPGLSRPKEAILWSSGQEVIFADRITAEIRGDGQFGIDRVGLHWSGIARAGEEWVLSVNGSVLSRTGVGIRFGPPNTMFEVLGDANLPLRSFGNHVAKLALEAGPGSFQAACFTLDLEGSQRPSGAPVKPAACP
jgi:hypothetical protein